MSTAKNLYNAFVGHSHEQAVEEVYAEGFRQGTLSVKQTADEVLADTYDKGFAAGVASLKQEVGDEPVQ